MYLDETFVAGSLMRLDSLPDIEPEGLMLHHPHTGRSDYCQIKFSFSIIDI